MAVRHQHLQIAESGDDADTAVGLVKATDFAGVGVLLVRDDTSSGKGDETVHKGVGAIGRDIDAILRNSVERRIGGRFEVPVELHLHAARPLDDGIYANGIFERRDNQVGSGDARGLDGLDPCQ